MTFPLLWFNSTASGIGWVGGDNEILVAENSKIIDSFDQRETQSSEVRKDSLVPVPVSSNIYPQIMYNIRVQDSFL